MNITSYEKEIIRVLLKRKSWINTTHVASLTKMSWNTAIKYLNIMHEKGWVMKKGNYWKIRK